MHNARGNWLDLINERVDEGVERIGVLIRLFSLRLREVGMLKSSPSKIISESTNWSYLNELNRELKA